MKTLAELRTEIELGVTVYPSTHPDVYVDRAGEGSYCFVAVLQGGKPMVMGYPTLDDLLADDLMGIVSQPVWSTTKPEDDYAATVQEIVRQAAEFSLSQPEFLEQLKQSPSWQNEEVQAEVQKRLRSWGVSDTLLASLDEKDDESIILLNCQIGKDAADLVAHYFPGSTVTSIRSEYHGGVFIGDFSIALTCAVDHPFLQQVVIGFNNEDVPGRPDSWQKLCSLHIDLFVTRFTLINPVSGKPITYGVPGMYQEAIKEWCDTHDDGGCSSLYGSVKTPDMFIITTELLSHSHEEIEQTAKLLAVQAKAKIEQEWPASTESPNSDDTHPF